MSPTKTPAASQKEKEPAEQNQDKSKNNLPQEPEDMFDFDSAEPTTPPEKESIKETPVEKTTPEVPEAINTPTEAQKPPEQVAEVSSVATETTQEAVPETPSEVAEPKPEAEAPPEQVPEAIPEEKAEEVSRKPAAKKASAKAEPITQPSPIKSATRKEIEDILSEDLADAFSSMDEQHRKLFKQKGEETASKIEQLIEGVKFKTKQIVKLIRDWLKIIPRINPFFLEQQAKIKAGKIVKLVKNKREDKE